MSERYQEEQAKLTAFLVNGLSLALIVSALVGPLLPDSGEESLTGPVIRAIFGIALHLAAKLALRAMWPKPREATDGTDNRGGGVGHIGGPRDHRGGVGLPQAGQGTSEAMSPQHEPRNWFR